jgi:hypothetical protein
MVVDARFLYLRRESQPAIPDTVNLFRLACASVAVCLLAIKTHGDIVCVWSYDATIRRFDSNGVGSIFATGDVSGWNGPVGLALDNVGNLYAGVPSQSWIYKFSPSGARSIIGSFDSISGLAFDSTGNLYGTCPNYVEIGKLVYGRCMVIGYCDFSPWTQSHLDFPVNLAFNSAGTIYVSSSRWAWPGPIPHPGIATTIETYSTDLAYLGSFATGLNEPYGLAFDTSGNLYVANSGTNGALVNTIVKFTPAGLRSTFASATNGLSRPTGLAFDSAGNLFVANLGNGTIVKLTPDGGSVFASGLNSPTSIAVFPGLNLWSATPITLSNPKTVTNGMFQFDLHENLGLTLTVLGTTNVSLPLTNWTALGSVSEVSPGMYRFVDTQATNFSQRFYRVVAP